METLAKADLVMVVVAGPMCMVRQRTLIGGVSAVSPYLLIPYQITTRMIIASRKKKIMNIADLAEQ